MASRENSENVSDSRGSKRKSQVLEEINSNDNKKRKSCLTTSNQLNIIKTNDKSIFKRSKHSKNDKSNQLNIISNELTPYSTISSSGFCSDIISPLPKLNYANSVQVWNLMLKNDDMSTRDYRLFSRHQSLQPMMRSTLLDWLNEVCQAYNLTRQTYYLALDFFDRYLSEKKDVPKNKLQLLGITCLFIAAKIEEIFPPKLSRFSFVCDGACEDADILKKELVILNALKWELHPITPIAWLKVFMKIYAIHEKENVNTLRNKPVNESFLYPDYEEGLFVQIAHLIDLCTLDAGSLAFSYSVIAASAFFHFTNEIVVLECTGKSMPEIRACVEWMIPFAIAIKNAGFDFVNKCETEPTIQTHTISMELLQNAQAIQREQENERMTMLESDNSSLCSLPMTPPRSTDIL